MQGAIERRKCAKIETKVIQVAPSAPSLKSNGGVTRQKCHLLLPPLEDTGGASRHNCHCASAHFLIGSNAPHVEKTGGAVWSTPALL